MNKYQFELSASKKNILYISPDFNLACGVSKHVFNLLSSKELKKEFNLYFITNGGDALFKLNKAGIDYSNFNFKKDKIIHMDFFINIRELKDFCRDKEIHLIHSHHRYPEFLSNIIKKSTGIITVMTVHNFVIGLKSFSYNSDVIIAISNAISKHLNSNFKIVSEKIKVLYNCVEKENAGIENRDNIKQKIGVPNNKKVILYVGKFNKEKGTDVLLKAFRKTKEYNNKIVLIMVGGIKDLLNFDESNQDDILIFQPQENISDLYSISDVVILPSNIEGLGYTMLESGLYQIPFIGSNTGGISEFIEDNSNGLLFESGNAGELASKIQYVLDHPQEAKNFALKLNEKVNELCNPRDYISKLINIYNDVLSQ